MSKPKAKARNAKPGAATRKARPAPRKTTRKAVHAKPKPAPVKSKPSASAKSKAKRVAKPVKVAKSVKPAKPAAKPTKTSRPAKLKRTVAATRGTPAEAKRAAPKLAKPAQSSPAADKPASSQSIMESAQHIWLAGLGAFAKAQEEGGRLFENLIKEGSSLEQKTRKIATGKAGDLRGAMESGVNQVRERTQETWDRLEQVFEDRVSRALAKLGVPGRKELDELQERIEELSTRFKKLRGVPLRSSLGQTIGSGMRRARDDLSDLARELEEAQHAAKLQMKRSVAKVKKSIKDAAR
ncbi:MAG: phasin family protein [Rudaea sp.]